MGFWDFKKWDFGISKKWDYWILEKTDFWISKNGILGF